MDILAMLGGTEGGFSLDAILKEDTLRALIPVIESMHEEILNKLIEADSKVDGAFKIGYNVALEEQDGKMQPIIRQVALKQYITKDGESIIGFAAQKGCWNLFDILGQAKGMGVTEEQTNGETTEE